MKVFIIGNEDNKLGFEIAEREIVANGDTPINIYWFNEKLDGFTVADLAALAFELIRISDAVVYIDEKLDFMAALERGKATGDKKAIYLKDTKPLLRGECCDNTITEPTSEGIG